MEQLMDYKLHLKKLRATYISGTPAQRLSISFQRIAYPNAGPNQLIAHVSVIEGFARSLVMHQEANDRSDKTSIYPEYQYKKIKDLIVQYLNNKGECVPESVFGSDVWRKFGYAIEYRNLLIHESTYLGQDTYPELLEACTQVLSKLAKLENLDNRLESLRTRHLDRDNLARESLP
jgi:hypothetical protein